MCESQRVRYRGLKVINNGHDLYCVFGCYALLCD